MFDCLVSPSGSIFLLVPRVMDMQLERSTIISVVTITLLTQLTPAWSAPGGMFRRAESTTYPAASAAEQSTNNAEVNAQNLVLSAPIPSSVSLSNQDIVWEVQAINGSRREQLHGRSLRLALPIGAYNIHLLIGSYEEKVGVDIAPGKVAVPNFAANIGILQGSSDTPADWEIYVNPDKGKQPMIRRQGSSRISAIVGVGEYTVVAHGNNTTQRQSVRIERGNTEQVALKMPIGKVNLVATLENFPAMRAMSWKLYRLDGGRKEIAAPRRHTATLEVPPGHYEAVATLDGRERRREFTVLDGTSSNIVLAMD